MPEKKSPATEPDPVAPGLLRPVKPDAKPLAVTISGFRALVPISKTSLYGLIAAKRVRTCRISGRTLILMESIEALLAETERDGKR